MYRCTSVIRTLPPVSSHPSRLDPTIPRLTTLTWSDIQYVQHVSHLSSRLDC